jgi:hypothetical protein
MGLNTAGITVLLDAGTTRTLYAALADGPTSADQVSAARVLVVWNPATGAMITADGAPLQFTGTPSAAVTSVLLFSAATAGTFYGYGPLVGDATFNALGQFNIAYLAIAGSASPLVPPAPYALGVEVGVPEGTVLTNRASLGSPTSTETYTLVLPNTGETNTITVSVWRHINFTQTITPAPGAGNHFRFDECTFTGQGNWCVEVDQTGRTNDIMEPLVVFTNCEFDGGAGGGLTDKCLLGGSAWVINCDMRNAEDGWSGWYYNVGMNSNFVGFGPDISMHTDGVQTLDTGHSVFWRSWLEASGVGGNAAFRVGTEAGATTDIKIFFCGLSGGGYTMQMRGDSGGPDIDNITVQGCLWTRVHEFGPTDFVQVTAVTWTDNAYFDGEVIAAPA